MISGMRRQLICQKSKQPGTKLGPSGMRPPKYGMVFRMRLDSQSPTLSSGDCSVHGMALDVRIQSVRPSLMLKLTFRVFKFNNVFTVYIDITIYLYN